MKMPVNGPALVQTIQTLIQLLANHHLQLWVSWLEDSVNKEQIKDTSEVT